MNALGCKCCTCELTRQIGVLIQALANAGVQWGGRACSKCGETGHNARTCVVRRKAPKVLVNHAGQVLDGFEVHVE